MNKWRKTFSILTVVALVVVSGSTWLSGIAHAATGSIYLTPTTKTVNKGNNFTVTVRVNPGTAINTVDVILNFNAAKLQYVTNTYAGSPFNNQYPGQNTSGKVEFAQVGIPTTAGDPPVSVSTDAYIATVTFKALADTGTDNITLTGSESADATTSQPQHPATMGATITFLSNVCPSGQTGTPPNCTAVSTGGTSGTTGGTSGTKTTPTSTAPKSGSTVPTPASGGTQSTTTVKPVGTPATVTAQAIQYTKATITFTTKSPTTAYAHYGLGGALTTNTPISPFSTNHTISLDTSTLLPGETYSYVLITTDSNGTVSQTAVKTFKTKGLKISLTLTDRAHKPLKNKTITLHSNPMTSKTDSKGNVTFTDVTPGNHEVIYTDGSKSYHQTISVANNVQASGEVQTAASQTFSVVYGLTQTSMNMAWVWMSTVILVIVVLVILGRTGRLGFAMQLRTHDYVAPVSTAAVVVGDNEGVVRPGDNSSQLDNEQRASVQEHLNAIPNPPAPMPGASVNPQQDDTGFNNGINR